MNKEPNENKSEAIDNNNNGEVWRRDDGSQVSEAIFSLRYFGGQPPDVPPAAALIDLIGQCRKPDQKRLTPTDLDVNEARFCLGKDHVTNFMLPLMRKDDGVRNATWWLSFNRIKKMTQPYS
ncbi:hypothetical protein V6N13_031766 [Hibiscus sabdariffa]|uniref:Uncharacterized protein n=2 Tax=Hibiscus sabdariffa TaxID=183260 RepID=A0ABR2ND07_9ROSI